MQFKLAVRTFAITLLVMMTLAAGVRAVVVATPTYAPGVSPGNWAAYSSSGSWNSTVPTVPPPPPISDIIHASSIRNIVTSVSGTSITAEQSLTLNNYTSVVTRTQTLTGDVKTGVGNLTLWVLAGNLTQGDRIYENSTAPVLNSTTTMTFLGAVRTVNVYNLTLTQAGVGYQANFKIFSVWDKPTGVLLQLSFFESIASSYLTAQGIADVRISDTNLWTAITLGEFTLTANPTTATLSPGQFVDSKLALASVDGFSGNITLNATSTGPNSSLLLLAFDYSTAYISPQQSVVLHLRVQASLAAVPEDYLVSVTAVSANAAHNVTIRIIVNTATLQDFTVTASHDRVVVSPGATNVTFLFLNAQNGFAGQVDLRACPVPHFRCAQVLGLPVFIEPASVILSPSTYGTGSSTFSVMAQAGAQPGDYEFDIKADGGSIVHFINITVHVTPQAPVGTYTPGVKPGDSAFYNIQAMIDLQMQVPNMPSIPSIDHLFSITTTIISVTGSMVTAMQTLTFQNMTVRSSLLSGDVNSGAGNIAPWVIAGNLGAGDMIINQPSSPTINYTITRYYAGASRMVNVLILTRTMNGIYLQLNSYWDKQTGLLLEESVNAAVQGLAQAVLDIRVTDTNIWSQHPGTTTSTPTPPTLQTPTSPSMEGPLLFGGIAGLAAVLVGLDVVGLRRRKTATTPPPMTTQNLQATD